MFTKKYSSIMDAYLISTLFHKKQYKNPITTEQRIGFNILSSIFKFRKSIIRKISAPQKAIINMGYKPILASNNNNTIVLIPKEAENPAIYPIKVLSEDLGKCIFPNRSPKIEATPSPIVAIKAAAANIPNGKKKIGIKDNIKIAGLMKVKFSLRFIVFPNKCRT